MDISKYQNGTKYQYELSRIATISDSTEVVSPFDAHRYCYEINPTIISFISVLQDTEPVLFIVMFQNLITKL